MDGIAIQGDYFRANAPVVAAAASMGLISTMRPDGGHGRHWRVTRAGMNWLWEGNRI